MKAPSKKQAKAAALQLHSLIVRANGNGCAAAGVLPGVCGPGRQCAHIVPKKRNQWVSTDPDNGWVLCNGHHRMVDTDPARWLRLVIVTVGANAVLMWQEYSDLVREDPPCSPLKWWRREVVELMKVAESVGADLSQVPAHVKRWVYEQQQQEAEL